VRKATRIWALVATAQKMTFLLVDALADSINIGLLKPEKVPTNIHLPIQSTSGY